MPSVNPFTALRPATGKCAIVSFDGHSNAPDTALQQEMQLNVDSYLHVIKQHVLLGEKKDPEKHFPREAAYLQEMLQKGVLKRDPAPSFYIYRQIKEGHVFTGLVAGCQVADFRNNTIRKHEHTRTEKLKDLVKHIAVTKAIATPVLLTYHATPATEEVFQQLTTVAPDEVFTDEKGIDHLIWVIHQAQQVAQIRNAFGQCDNFYIADGHHRSGATMAFSEEWPEGEQTQVLSYLVPDKDLYILPFHRVIKGLKPGQPEELIRQLTEHFEVQPTTTAQLLPELMHQFGVYYKGNAFQIRVKPAQLKGLDPLGILDVSILENEILKPLLDIHDSKTDERILFLDGTRSLKSIIEMIDQGEADLAFFLYPTTIQQVMDVAEMPATMPPKSTYVEPKLRGGMIIYQYEQALAAGR